MYVLVSLLFVVSLFRPLGLYVFSYFVCSFILYVFFRYVVLSVVMYVFS